MVSYFTSDRWTDLSSESACESAGPGALGVGAVRPAVLHGSRAAGDYEPSLSLDPCFNMYLLKYIGIACILMLQSLLSKLIRNSVSRQSIVQLQLYVGKHTL